MGSGYESVSLHQRGRRARREGGADDDRHQCNEPRPPKQASSERVKRRSHDGDHAGSFIKRHATQGRERKLAEIRESLVIERHGGQPRRRVTCQTGNPPWRLLVIH